MIIHGHSLLKNKMAKSEQYGSYKEAIIQKNGMIVNQYLNFHSNFRKTNVSSSTKMENLQLVATQTMGPGVSRSAFLASGVDCCLHACWWET